MDVNEVSKEIVCDVILQVILHTVMRLGGYGGGGGELPLVTNIVTNCLKADFLTPFAI